MCLALCKSKWDWRVFTRNLLTLFILSFVFRFKFWNCLNSCGDHLHSFRTKEDCKRRQQPMKTTQRKIGVSNARAREYWIGQMSIGHSAARTLTQVRTGISNDCRSVNDGQRWNYAHKYSRTNRHSESYESHEENSIKQIEIKQGGQSLKLFNDFLWDLTHEI